MSTRIMSLCWPLSMPPTAKSVLVSLADNANDAGVCWPSIPTICERTCYSRRAVIRAIAWLESANAIQPDRTNGRHTKYVVTPESYVEPVPEMHQCISGTGASKTKTGASLAPDQCISGTTPVPQRHSNRKEPSRTVEATKEKRASAPPCPLDVPEQVWQDWLTLRKAKKASVTETVLSKARGEAGKAGMSLADFLTVWCFRGSQGLEADWLKPHEKAQFAEKNGSVPPTNPGGTSPPKQSTPESRYEDAKLFAARMIEFGQWTKEQAADHIAKARPA